MHCQEAIIESHVNILATTRQVEIKAYMLIFIVQKFLKKIQKNFHVDNYLLYFLVQ